MRFGPELFSLLFIVCVVFTTGCTESSTAPVATTFPVTTTATVVTIVPDKVTAPTEAPITSLAIREYVDNATLFAQQQGKTAALAAFNNKTGPFVLGDVYVYALDYNGTALALPFQPEQVGTGFLGRLDGGGKAFTDVEIQLVKEGGGYLLYRYPHPGGDAPETLKISYVRAVDDTYWIGAGIYTNSERLIDPELRQFTDEAKAYAIKEGREKAVLEFNNLNGSFIRGDLYIFAYDYNGTVLAWPYRPDQIGVNRYNATDSVGTHHIRAMVAAAGKGSGMVDYYSVNPKTNRTDLKISYIEDIDGTYFIGAGRYIEPDERVLAL